MQDAQPPGLQVLQRAGAAGSSPGAAERERVDGEVAAQQVVLQRAPARRRAARPAPRSARRARSPRRSSSRRRPRRCRSARGRPPPRRARRGGSTSPSTTRSSSPAAARAARRAPRRRPPHAVPGRVGVEQPRAAGQRAQRVEGLGGGAHAGDCGRYPSACPRPSGGHAPAGVDRAGPVALLLAAGAVRCWYGSARGRLQPRRRVRPARRPARPPPSPAEVHHQRAPPVRRRVRVADLRLHQPRALPAARPAAAPAVHARWKVTGWILLEFPPVLCGRSLYLLKNNGALYSISRRTGSPLEAQARLPRRLLARLLDGTVYSVLLARGKGIKAGRVVAVAARTGRTRWSRKLPSRAESSPLIDHGRLYFGTEDGTVYALHAADGAVAGPTRPAARSRAGWRWTTAGSSSATTAARSPPCAARRQQLWKERAARVRAEAGQLLRHAGGRLRPRLHRQHRRLRVLASARDGKLAWRHKTGGYVYSSPAVAAGQRRGRRSTPGPTTAICTPSTRAPATCAGRTSGRQDLGRADRHRRPRVLLQPRHATRRRRRRGHRQEGVVDGPWRVQPRDLRRPAHLPRRLLQPVHAHRAPPGPPRRARLGALRAQPAGAPPAANRAQRARRALAPARDRTARWRRAGPPCAGTGCAAPEGGLLHPRRERVCRLPRPSSASSAARGRAPHRCRARRP